jgi:hypothetical protein
MIEAQGNRFGAILIACLIGIGVPAFLLGPFIFDGIPFELASTAAKLGSLGCGIFGLWLIIVAIFSDATDVVKVIEPFQAGDAVLLLLPYMLYVGTKGIWRRLFRKHS